MKNFLIRNKIPNILDILALLGSLAIIISLSYEILIENHYRPESPISLNIQLVVCSIFILDYFVRWIISQKKGHFFTRNIILLLSSLPYVNFVHHYQIDISNDVHYLLGFVPLLRGGYGLVLITRWFTRRSITSLMVSYMLIIVASTYFTSLIFLVAERDFNSEVNTYWDSLWWAGMNLTTVGCNIVAVTAIGKILSVFISISGLMIFPIFTVFIMDLVKGSRSTKKTNNNDDSKLIDEV